MSLWLESTGKPTRCAVCSGFLRPFSTLLSKYKVCVCDEALLWSFRIEARTVRFRVHAGDEGTLPLPDTAAFHAACARALGLSGAADYMDLCDDEAEDLRVLAADGSSGGLLLDKLNNSIVPSP